MLLPYMNTSGIDDEVLHVCIVGGSTPLQLRAQL